MGKRALVTGGAGFVGSHLSDELLEHGYEVRVLDNLCSQVHGKLRSKPSYLSRDVEFIEGDIRDPDVVYHALSGVDIVFHLAAAVGPRPSMKQISHFIEINNLGTAVLLEAIIEQPIERLVLASSLSVYGEGSYRAPGGSLVNCALRSRERLKRGDWEIRCDDGSALTPVPTPESKPLNPGSIYAVSKREQEEMCLLTAAEHGVSAAAIRLFSVYGPRQMPGNSYTGELSVFASCLCSGQPPIVDEDGCQMRDWVNVHDATRALRLAAESEKAGGEILNIGSGRACTMSEVAQAVSDVMGFPELEPAATGKSSHGSIRHCFADISKAQQILGYQPQVSLEQGLEEMAEWFACKRTHSTVAESGREQVARGIVV